MRIESGAARAKMAAQKDITVSKRISGDQDGDACISGSGKTNLIFAEDCNSLLAKLIRHNNNNLYDFFLPSFNEAC